MDQTGRDLVHKSAVQREQNEAELGFGHRHGRDDNESFLLQELKQDPSLNSENTGAKAARNPYSISALVEAARDVTIALTALCFLAFGILVYTHEGKPVVAGSLPAKLLAAAHYGPTVFPIVFTGIVAKFLKALAAWKLERGASVLTLEQLLGSRTVLSTMITPLSLRTISLITPPLILLWVLSPVGGQASLRVASTIPLYTNVTASFSFVDFLSPFISSGPAAHLSSGLITAVNAAFTSALMSQAMTEPAGQDAFGNIKIPLLEALAHQTNESDWTSLNNDKPLLYSSLAGLRTSNIDQPRTTYFAMETSYMYTNCTLTHQGNYSFHMLNSMSTYWSGANFGVTDNPMWWGYYESTGTPDHVIFKSFSYPSTLTIANCSLTQTYVEVNVQCRDGKCQSTAIRTSTRPHNNSAVTPLSGMTNADTDYTEFWPSFVRAFDNETLCDVFCMASPIELYFTRPNLPFSMASMTGAEGTKDTSPPIWPIGDVLFSQRFTQLVNTFWIDNIAPFAVTGKLTFPNASAENTIQQGYNTVNTTGHIETEEIVLWCHRTWLGLLLIASSAMFLAGIANALLTGLRKGPDVLDRFSAQLRDNPYTENFQDLSMEHASHQARRFGRAKVILGDVKPESEIGHVAIATPSSQVVVTKLRSGRMYK